MVKAAAKRQKRRKQRNQISLILFALVCMALVVGLYALAFYKILGSGAKEINVNSVEKSATDHGVVVPQAPKPAPKPPQKLKPAGVTIGYAVTITGCGSDPITEGAAVLKHAIHLVSAQGNIGGRYGYQMYALYHPDGEACAAPLKDLGYELVKRDTPVAVSDIEGDNLREKIHKNGCCGEKELVKLEAYTLTQHPIIVHLDLDVVILKPMDALFDWMLADPSEHDYDFSDVPVMWTDQKQPQRPNAFFTRDCTLYPRRRGSYCFGSLQYDSDILLPMFL